MQIYRGIEELTDVRDSVVAIGSFDGVHLGHRHILQWLCTAARERNLRSVVITFDPHPRQVLKHDPSFFTINTLQKNLSLMEEQGVDAALVLPLPRRWQRATTAIFCKNMSWMRCMPNVC